MGKKIYLLNILCILLLTNCSKKEENSSTNSSSQIEQHEQITNFEIIKQIKDKISFYDNFMIKTQGNTIAKQGIIQYNQDINTQTYAINRQFYINTKTTSFLIQYYHQAYANNQVVYYYDTEHSQLQKETFSQYQEKYGIIPSYETIFSFNINSNTIKECFLTKSKNGLSYSFILDEELSTSDLKIQMKQFGGLKEDPIFDKIVVTIVINNHLQLQSFQSYAKYQIKKDLLGTFNCTQQLNSQIFYDNYPKADLSIFS